MEDITLSGLTPKEKTVCALGLFDGVHKGHQLIIGSAVQKAKQISGKSAVFCFKTNTVTSKGHDGRLEMIMSDEQKHEKMSKAGAEFIYSPDFEMFKGMDPETFVRDILVGRLNCSWAVCGVDFTFGKGAAGKAEDLVSIGEKYGMKTLIVDPLKYNGEIISSTEIRKCIREGNVKKANLMLGSPFEFVLPVEHGFKRGREWGFPTINQSIPRGRVMPKFGVYCSRVTADGREYAGVTNIGLKPTVDEDIDSPLAETFILDFDGDLYGKTVRVKLLDFVRPEKRFDSFESLKEEIGKNVLQVKSYFKTNG